MALREQLQAVAEELRRRKAAGDKTVPISEDTLVALRAAVARAKAETGLRIADCGMRIGADSERPTSPSPVALPPVVAAQPSGTIAPAPRAESKPAVIPPAAAQAPFAPAPAGRGAALFGDTAPVKPVVKLASVQSGAAIPPPPVFTLPAGDKATRWAWLKARVENDPVCRAHVRPGKKVVLGVGTLEAKLFFCGDAPGPEEAEQGEPFVGAAGQLLTKMIKGMGLDRGQVYIGSLMNWRPEMPTPEGMDQIGNRPPTPEELGYCLPHLRAQLEIVQPEVIVALGATAAVGLLGAGSFKALGEVRGRWHTFAGRPVMVTYHPSYLLRNNSNRAKRTVWEDLLLVMERAQVPISDKQRNFFLER